VQVLTALLRVVDPGLWFDEIGGFGPQNDHYIRDTAAFEGSTGVIALIAAFTPAWRIPTLALLALQYATHAISHVVDVDNAHPEAVGVVDLVLVAGGAAALLWALRQATRAHA
jgi:hypothetical protein